MGTLSDFQLFARLISRYRPGSAILGPGAACLGRGARGRELLVRGAGGLGELAGQEAEVVHLWDPSPRAVEPELRRRGFEPLWTNHLLEVAPGRVRSGPVDVREISSAAERDALARALGEAEAPRYEPPSIRAIQATGSGGAPQGGASFAIDEGVLYVADVFVDPRHRLSGVGSSLLSALAAVARRESCERIWAVSTRDARGFYSRSGFEPGICITSFQRSR